MIYSRINDLRERISVYFGISADKRAVRCHSLFDKMFVSAIVKAENQLYENIVDKYSMHSIKPQGLSEFLFLFAIIYTSVCAEASKYTYNHFIRL